MTPQTLFTITGVIFGALATLVTWGFITGRFVQRRESDGEAITALRLEFNRRFDDANKEMSKATSYMQTLESRVNLNFVGREVADARFAEHRRELDALHADAKDLRRAVDGLKDANNHKYRS